MMHTNEFYPNICIKCNIWVKLDNKDLKEIPKTFDYFQSIIGFYIENLLNSINLDVTDDFSPSG